MFVYRILSIDGGGIRGIVPIRLMQRLCAVSGLEDWLAQCDLIAGTSTGGILALGIAAGLSLEELATLYTEKGGRILDDSLWDDVRDLGKTVGAEYSNRELRKQLQQAFGERPLSQLGKRVMVTAFDLDNEERDPSSRSWKPKIFHNFPGDDSDGDRLARDVALYTSAAPTYFPSADGYIDGGVFANNPSLCALAQALDRRRPCPPAVEDIRLLSLGTGVSPSYIRRKNLDWGLAQWASPLIRILMDGVSGISDFQCSQLLGDAYHRVQILFPPGENIPVDAVSKLPQLERLATDHDLSETVAWLRSQWCRTTPAR